jgi:hypothetical protein
VLLHHSYSPDFSPAEFFLFPEVKQHLANVTQTQGTFRSSWERAIRTITTDEFATADGQSETKSVSVLAVNMLINPKK